MKVSEQLDLAADMIQQHGWGKGVNSWQASRGAGLCIEGGIAAATGTGFRLDVLYRCPAYRAVMDYLGRDAYMPLYVWNDDEARDEQQVVETLRAAAAVERTKEAIPAEVAS